jgi:outer membrane protein assembly factor BamB
VSLSNYLATGLVVFDLGRMSLKWAVHLDLSTDAASYKAYAYSSPTAADADGDGALEIYVGTSVGFVYAFAPSGVLRPGYPLQLGEVQAGVSLADLDGDGALELLVADTRGNVASFDAASGREKWERHLASMAAQSATFADVNADGVLDVILPTADGRVHVLHGATGADVAHFPFATGARIMAPVTPVPAPPGASASMPPVTLIAASFDGFVYFINGISGAPRGLMCRQHTLARAHKRIARKTLFLCLSLLTRAVLPRLQAARSRSTWARRSTARRLLTTLTAMGRAT